MHRRAPDIKDVAALTLAAHKHYKRFWREKTPVADFFCNRGFNNY